MTFFKIFNTKNLFCSILFKQKSLTALKHKETPNNIVKNPLKKIFSEQKEMRIPTSNDTQMIQKNTAPIQEKKLCSNITDYKRSMVPMNKLNDTANRAPNAPQEVSKCIRFTKLK